MYCKICGQYNNDGADRCKSCGANLLDGAVVYAAPSQTGKICPKCGNSNCQTVSETFTTGNDFSVGNGCCGYILFGPVGILCGLCGTNKKTVTSSYWVCPNCGYKFKL